MEKNSRNYILVKGAKENNLKNIDCAIPKNSLTVFTGVSGSGKSTLAFDTIFAEGQRRYVESLSSYARQFLGGFEKPDVETIEGLSPAISIDQKSTSHNPRSSVGTVTEIYDYLRLLFARIGVPYCPHHHKPIHAYSPVAMTNAILQYEAGTKVQILAPIVKNEKGTHADTLEKIRKQGFSRVRVDGAFCLIEEVPDLEKNTRHDIDIVIDRLVIRRLFTFCRLFAGDVRIGDGLAFFAGGLVAEHGDMLQRRKVHIGLHDDKVRVVLGAAGTLGDDTDRDGDQDAEQDGCAG